MPLFSIYSLSKVCKSSVTNGCVLIRSAACKRVLSKVNPRGLTRPSTKKFSCFAPNRFSQKVSFSLFNKINSCNCSTKISVNCNEENAGSDCMHNNDAREATDIVQTDNWFKEIANGDAKIEQQLKVLQLEIEVLHQEGSLVPSKLKKQEWEELLSKNSISGRKKYLKFLFKIEKKMEADKSRKQIRMLKRLEEKKEKMEDCHLNYGFEGALLYSQPIVIDCSYENYMTKLNKKLCAKQIMFMYSDLRVHRAPFHVKLCNVNMNDEWVECFRKFLPNAFDDKFLWDVHKESYLDLYPKNRLVYLSPHATHELIELDHNDIYIIGAFVDRGTGEKVSVAKAKESNIKLAKLPLDRFLHWEKGTKNLPLNTVLKVLMDMRAHNDWNKALENIPRRCIQASPSKRPKKKIYNFFRDID